MSKKTKAVAGSILAILLVGAAAGSLACASKGFKDWDTKNWETNLKDVFSKVADATKEKVADLNADLTNSKSTYVLPESMTFGYNDAIKSTITTDNESSNLTTASLVNDEFKVVKQSFNETFKTVNVVAYLTPSNADYTAVEWTVAWSNPNSTWATGKTVADYVSVAKGDLLAAIVTCKQGFSEPIVLKVKVTKNEISVANTCLVEYYKQLTSISLSLTGDAADKVVNAGDMFTYSAVDNFGNGTRSLSDYGSAVNTFTTASAVSNVATINYDFASKNSVIGFDYDVFYGLSTNFTFKDGTSSVLNGKGRNAVNTILDSTVGDMTFKISKGTIVSNIITFDITKESVIYPESVTIGDGTDVVINPPTAKSYSVFVYLSETGVDGTYTLKPKDGNDDYYAFESSETELTKIKDAFLLDHSTWSTLTYNSSKSVLNDLNVNLYFY